MKGLILMPGACDFNGALSRITGLKVIERLVFTLKEADIKHIVIAGVFQGRDLKSIFSGRILRDTSIRFLPADSMDELQGTASRAAAEYGEDFIVSRADTVVSSDVITSLASREYSGKDVNCEDTVYRITSATLGDFLGGGAVSWRRVEASGYVASVRSRADLKAATRMVLDAIKKPMSIDGVVAYYIMRRLTLPVSRLLAWTPVTPNMLTVMAFLVELVGVIMIAGGGFANLAWGMTLFLTGAYIDCFDGEIARLKFMKSRIGAWLDTLFDDLSNMGLVIALSVALYDATGSTLYVVLGGVTLLFMVVSVAYLYYELIVEVKHEDVNMVPMFFDAEDAPRTTGVRLIGVLKYIVKRDFYTMAYFILALFNLPVVILATLLAGAVSAASVIAFQVGASGAKQHASKTTRA